ncbi:AAA family ATPase [Colletotrichum higginsianum]|nr:AAA family ATPase [Colletotrichum higginsianum]
MKYSLAALFAAVASAAVIDTDNIAEAPEAPAAPELPALRARATGCNADNCLRAVRATRYGTATMELRLAECSSFLAVTETPSATTVFVTESSIETLTANVTRTLYQRQAAAEETAAVLSTQTVPVYASACSDAARYSSACSCFGATAVTTTAPAATFTSTVTVVSTTIVAPFVNVTRPALSCSTVWNCGDATIPVCSTESGCVCFRTAEGRDVCAMPNECESGCDSTSDCGNGEVCIKQSCCAGGTCMKVDVCLNEILPKMMFKRRSAAWVKKQARANLNHLSLVPHDAEEEED